VTGAGGALGRELCLEFAKLGCAVACADIVDDEAEKTVNLVKEKYPGVIVRRYHCNVTSTEDIKLMYHAVMKDIGKVDILVNNAGILRRNVIQKLEDDRIDRVIDINLKSQFKVSGESEWASCTLKMMDQLVLHGLFAYGIDGSPIPTGHDK